MIFSGLADGFGYERFHLAGHDFGAMVSWNLARRHPERLNRLAICNVPHPVVMQSYLRTHSSQMLKSWYAFFFQLPWLPEFIIKTSKWKMLMAAMPKNLTAEERNRYREAWTQPGAMTTMINWYRALMRQTRKSSVPSLIRVPTLVLWGKQDPHLSYEMAPLSVDLCEAGHLVTFEDATHWVLHDKPQEVSQLLIEHFSGEGENLPGTD
jgi:pimeloyl-ACP methyl ester carboxylesterase